MIMLTARWSQALLRVVGSIQRAPEDQKPGDCTHQRVSWLLSLGVVPSPGATEYWSQAPVPSGAPLANRALQGTVGLEHRSHKAIARYSQCT